MSLNFCFDLTQAHTFELRCDQGTRPLPQDQLQGLVEDCEAHYYSTSTEREQPAALVQLGRRLYDWLDGPEGWLRRGLDQVTTPQLSLDLTQTSEAQGLNPATQRVALGLAHLPWELLHDGEAFLLQRLDLTLLPVRTVQRRQQQPLGERNRPLRLLFMATAPEGVEPILSYEQEETNILTATQTQPLALIVEESGSVDQLTELVRSYEAGYFDVFHFSGHGLIYTAAEYGHLAANGIADGTPCLITEDDVGQMQLTTAPDLAQAFRGRWPRVIFLSACHSGQAPNRGIMSISTENIKQDLDKLMLILCTQWIGTEQEPGLIAPTGWVYSCNHPSLQRYRPLGPLASHSPSWQ